MRFQYQYDDEYTDYCQSHVANSNILRLIQPHSAWLLVLGIVYFSNLLVLTSTLLHFHKGFLWLQQQNKRIKTLYKASATVLTCVNIIALISDLYIVVSDGMHSADSKSDLLFIILYILLPTKGLLVLLILILGMPVVCFNTQPNTRCQRFTHVFVFCQIIIMVCAPAHQ